MWSVITVNGEQLTGITKWEVEGVWSWQMHCVLPAAESDLRDTWVWWRLACLGKLQAAQWQELSTLDTVGKDNCTVSLNDKYAYQQ